MIRLHRVILAEHSTTGLGFEPEVAGITEDEIVEYLKDHSMPHDPSYSELDLIHDLCISSGTLCFSTDLKEETVSFLEDILNALWK